MRLWEKIENPYFLTLKERNKEQKEREKAKMKQEKASSVRGNKAWGGGGGNGQWLKGGEPGTQAANRYY